MESTWNQRAKLGRERTTSDPKFHTDVAAGAIYELCNVGEKFWGL